jgi:hypothetical protein
MSSTSYRVAEKADPEELIFDPEVPLEQRHKHFTRFVNRLMATWGLVGLAFGGSIGFIWGQGLERQPEPTVAVQMYVMAVDDGADVERYAIEQAGDQFTYQLPEHILGNIQQTPFFAQCIDGLSITSVWTQFAEDEACPGTPHIRVVLIAPY